MTFIRITTPGRVRGYDHQSYRCRDCRKLLLGRPNRHGARCPSCGTGVLENVATVTARMLQEAETA